MILCNFLFAFVFRSEIEYIATALIPIYDEGTVRRSHDDILEIRDLRSYVAGLASADFQDPGFLYITAAFSVNHTDLLDSNSSFKWWTLAKYYDPIHSFFSVHQQHAHANVQQLPVTRGEVASSLRSALVSSVVLWNTNQVGPSPFHATCVWVATQWC